MFMKLCGIKIKISKLELHRNMHTLEHSPTFSVLKRKFTSIEKYIFTYRLVLSKLVLILKQRN